MKEINNKLITILFVMLLPLGVMAADIKVGFVNSLKILDEAPQTKEAMDAWQSEFSPKKDKLITEQAKLKKLEEKLVRDGALMSSSERKVLERDIMNQQRDLRRNEEEYNEDLNIRRNEVLQEVQSKVMNVINTMAKEENYDLIFSESGVVYFNESMDISDKVLSRLKK
ncbi:MAG: OmpH family outer membrane protein [Gammaproteobacteria bacterium]|nr:OmpH family outer membrane protein [Gammaproteobacteria bacterium]